MSYFKPYRSAVFATLCLLAPSLSGAAILDQSTGSSPELGRGGNLFVNSGASPFQTFTAGMTGTLSSVDLGLSYFGSSLGAGIASILDSTGNTLLGSSSFDSSGLITDLQPGFNTPLWKNVGFAGVDLTAGVQYRIRLSAQTLTYPNSSFTWELALGDIYAGGSGQFGPDLAFQTYMNPVPEPETYAMLLAGLGLLGFMGRRRKVKLVQACRPSFAGLKVVAVVGDFAD